VLRSSGGNLRVAQELLRHSSLSSPAMRAIYALVEDVERRRAIDKLV
jgi:site-specific recombinase XerD